MSNVWFTSDHHWGHGNIIKYCSRPFTDVEAMNEAMIDRWNARVACDDTVYHVGDFALRMDVPGVENLIRRLHGRIVLIYGNHDQKNKSVMRANGFVERVPYKEVKFGEQLIVMCHYPFVTWNKAHRGSWSLHGHSHGKLRKDPTARRLDVGVDVWNYAPVSYDEVAAEMAKVVFEPVDHHGAAEEEKSEY